ncbi:ribosomal protein S18-alanine N-acetyltransferase [Phytomonospora sp. NPDC050363]|uniref:ribosomal protein S18-alanine N-acetyltransferase n=1 Tax=Phytomonospora sp. NPDC050363 TaxID=3155642 RepID=UPI0033FE71B6
MRLERLRWWHIEDLLPIEREVFGAEAWSPAMFWSELAAGHHYLVVLDGGAAVGSSGDEGASGESVAAYGGLSSSGEDAWINNIAVVPGYRRRGLGRLLVEALLAEAARREARRVALEVAVDNGPAQRLYDAYGFKQIGLRRGYYQSTGTDALVMIKELS